MNEAERARIARRAASMLIRNHRHYGVRIQRSGRPGVWWVYTGNGIYSGELSIRGGDLCKLPAGRGARLHVLTAWMERAANPAPYRVGASAFA